MTEKLSSRTLAILAATRASDELLCRMILDAARNGASDDDCIQMTHDFRALRAANFFEMVDQVEARADADPEARRLTSRLDAVPDPEGGGSEN